MSVKQNCRGSGTRCFLHMQLVTGGKGALFSGGADATVREQRTKILAVCAVVLESRQAKQAGPKLLTFLLTAADPGLAPGLRIRCLQHSQAGASVSCVCRKAAISVSAAGHCVVWVQRGNFSSKQMYVC